MGSYDKACNNVAAVRFVQEHLKDCELIANQLNVPVANILGLAAAESQYGTGRIAREYKVHPKESAKTWVATYTSFLPVLRAVICNPVW